MIKDDDLSCSGVLVSDRLTNRWTFVVGGRVLIGMIAEAEDEGGRWS